MSVSVCGKEEEGRGDKDLGSFTGPRLCWANFSNLQTVWAQAQGSKAKDPALHNSRSADSSHSWTHIASRTSEDLDVLFPVRETSLEGQKELGL